MTKYVFGLTSWLAINVAFMVGLALGTVFRFFTYRTWVFTHAEDAQEAAAAMGFEELTAGLEQEFAEPEFAGDEDEREAAKTNPTPARR
jgi:putative flippase GtrA